MSKLKLNTDKETAFKILNKIYDNNGYCPCRLNKTKDTICPCKEMIENNKCHCGLFIDNE